MRWHSTLINIYVSSKHGERLLDTKPPSQAPLYYLAAQITTKKARAHTPAYNKQTHTHTYTLCYDLSCSDGKALYSQVMIGVCPEIGSFVLANILFEMRRVNIVQKHTINL